MIFQIFTKFPNIQEWQIWGTDFITKGRILRPLQNSAWSRKTEQLCSGTVRGIDKSCRGSSPPEAWSPHAFGVSFCNIAMEIGNRFGCILVQSCVTFRIRSCDISLSDVCYATQTGRTPTGRTDDRAHGRTQDGFQKEHNLVKQFICLNGMAREVENESLVWYMFQ